MLQGLPGAGGRGRELHSFDRSEGGEGKSRAA